MRCKGIGGILVGLSVFWGSSVWAQTTERGVIESPSAFVSGIGFISGWKCNAENITLKIWCNNLALPHKPVSMDVPRPDTEDICDGPDTNNGWIAQVNWNDYRNCTRVEAFDDGHMFASRDFTVGTISDEFIRDHDGTSIRVADFPVMGQVSRFVWSTATQHWEAMHSFPCREEDNCGDPTTDSGEGGDGNNNNPPVPYPEMQSIDGAYAGDQDLVQYKGMLALPPPTYQEALVRGDSVTWYSSFSFSMIFEPGAWVATHEVGEAERLISKRDLPERLGAVGKICTSTPLLHETGHVWVFNLTGVGGGITIYDGEDDDFYAETRVNRPDLAYEGGEDIQYFINKDTAEIGFKIVPHQLNKAGDGWLDAIRGNTRCDGTQGRQGDWAVRACEEVIKTRDAWFAKVSFPNQGRGPWRQVSGFRLTLRPGHIFRDAQSCVRVAGLNTSTAIPWPHSSFITDLTGTGKLEIVLASKPQYNAWRERDDLSIFLTPKLELGSVVD